MMDLIWKVLLWIPIWVWIVAGAALVAAFFPTFYALWRILPGPFRIALVSVVVGLLSISYGRKQGAKSALEAAEEKEKQDAEEIRRKAARADANIDRVIRDGRLREDDGWRRND